MQDWKSRYADKIFSAEDAVVDVRHGHRVFIGSGAGQPESLVEALAARRDLEDTEIVHIDINFTHCLSCVGVENYISF